MSLNHRMKKKQWIKNRKIHPRAPGAVRKGGLWLRIYKHSLSLAFGMLFLTGLYYIFMAA